MERIEEVISRALAMLDNDRYLLSSLISARVRELEIGAAPKIEGVDITKDKLTDIAIKEIANGHIAIRSVEDKKQ